MAAKPNLPRQASAPKRLISGSASSVELRAPRIHMMFRSEPNIAPRRSFGAISAR